MTALYVTHDQAEAVVLGDRIGVMRDGKLLQIGTPDQIYNRPADLFVANFTGATNELTGTLVARNGEYGVVDFGDGRRGEVALLQSLGPGDKVRIALRPENIGHRQARRRQHVSRARGRSPLSGHPDRLRHRAVRPPAGGARTRHRRRHQVGVETTVSLPRESCWAYRDTGPVVVRIAVGNRKVRSASELHRHCERSRSTSMRCEQSSQQKDGLLRRSLSQ